MYIKLENNEIKPYSLFQLRRDNPNTSFPKKISADLLTSYNIFECEQDVVPECDQLIETVESSGFFYENDEYIQKWQVVQLEQSIAENNIRKRRDKILQEEIDKINGIWWEQMSEEKKQQWRDYRQNLLDIPQQSGFPFNTIWPIKPE